MKFESSGRRPRARFPRILRDQRGMSLVQVMMAVVLMGIVSIGLAQLMTSLARIQGSALAQADLIDVMHDVEMALVRSDACMHSLDSAPEIHNQNAHSPPAFPIKMAKIVDEHNRPLLEVGGASDGQIGQTPLKLTSIEAQPSTPWQPNSLVQLEILLRIENGKNAILGLNSDMVRRLSLTIEVGADNKALACSRINIQEQKTLEQAICVSQGGVIAPSGVCDLKKSKSVLEAACVSMGLNLKGDHCE